ncbi:MAG: DPP IV N-terminal domain-containing protein, partial [Pyrinomonadaceae bacterium]|nr:DPP IV N-terminal domain-containing protein [Phycisphaerales bacterium]
MNRARFYVQCCTVAASLLVLTSVGSAARSAVSPATPPELLTIAESSEFTATARFDDVVALCDRIAAASPKKVRRADLGMTELGRSIPMMILADPPIETAEQAINSGKLVVLLIGNIHAGEMCGKEALPILAREILGLDAQASAATSDVNQPEEGHSGADASGSPAPPAAKPANPDANAGSSSGESGEGGAGKDDANGATPVRTSASLLKDLIIVMVPIYNADGNENIGPLADKRPGQVGPEGGDGVGTRENIDGLDLNRDFVKLEAAETRALVRFIAKWDPAVVVDTHTTNGSLHRHVITYAGPTNPAGDAKILEYTRDTMLPALTRSMEEKHGVNMFHYGNFEKAHSKWTTYPDLPRYGIPYIGMRNRIGILSEAYSYAPYKDRILATRDVCREVLLYTAEHKDAIRRLEKEADDRVIAAGRKPAADDLIPIRSEARAYPAKANVQGFVEEERDGKAASTGEPREYEVDFINDFKPTLSVRRPFAYLIPTDHADVIENLQRHGIRVEELREDVELDVEVYKVDSVANTRFPFQGHSLVDVSATAEEKALRMSAGTFVVRTAQVQGTLAAYLLEPRSTDGLTAWNFFDDQLVAGNDFPVTRVVEQTSLLTAPTRPLDDYREFEKPISYKVLYDTQGGRGGGGAPNFSGSPIGGLRWLPLKPVPKPGIDVNEAGNEGTKESAGDTDSKLTAKETSGDAAADDTAPQDNASDEWYVQMRDGVPLKVNALTGRAEKAYDLEPMTKALASMPTLSEQTAKSLVGPFMNMNAERSAAVFEYENDLYYATLDGSASRLTSSPEQEEHYSFSPDGKFIAFIRSNDLWAVFVKTHTERAITTGGTDLIRNVKNDWVYHEELFNRNWRAY